MAELFIATWIIGVAAWLIRQFLTGELAWRGQVTEVVGRPVVVATVEWAPCLSGVAATPEQSSASPAVFIRRSRAA